jgi:N-carbamoyl-L-amino-acid hydrolase
MTARNLPVDAGRLWDDVMALAAITEPDRPYTRRAFTPRFLEGRAFLARRFAEAGLQVRIDPAGNLIGRRPGRVPGSGTILIGSHSDTVLDGGRFDGAAGVIAALEAARALAEAGQALDHDLEVVDCLAEEANVYGVSCIGSRALAGRLTPELLAYAEPGGESVAQAIARMGGDPGRIAAARRGEVACFLELHIEQGRVLESEGVDVGVVSGIVGILRVELLVEGRADHAGTTPMALRADALCAAAAAILAVRAQAQALAGEGSGYFAATVGVIEVVPNAANVIPATARLVIDARAARREVMERFAAWVETALPPVVAGAGARLARSAVLSDSRNVDSDPGLCAILAESAQALGFSCRDITSGAGHDAAMLSWVAPSAMIFTPCRAGRSHCAEEWVEPEQLAAGAAVLHEAVLRFDRAKRGEDALSAEARAAPAPNSQNEEISRIRPPPAG